jgi:hypothetical protein
MSDIYELKARKYKYKYEKLKKQLEGGALQKELTQEEVVNIVTILTSTALEPVTEDKKTIFVKNILATITNESSVRDIHVEMIVNSRKYNQNNFDLILPILRIIEERIGELSILHALEYAITVHERKRTEIEEELVGIITYLPEPDKTDIETKLSKAIEALEKEKKVLKEAKTSGNISNKKTEIINAMNDADNRLYNTQSKLKRIKENAK